MKILVTGGSGFVGRHLSLDLKSRGHELHSLGRHDLSAKQPQIWSGSFLADLATDFTLPDLSEFGCVIHLAGHAHSNVATDEEALLHKKVNFIATEKLVRKAAADKVSKFIFLSSIAVYGEPQPYSHGEQPIVWTESTTTSPTTPYGKAKKHAEEALKKIAGDSMSYIILRPTLIYGSDAPGNFALLKKLLKTRLPLPIGSFKNQRSFLSIENLCSATALCAESDLGNNQTFNIADNDVVSTAQLIDWIAEAQQIRSPVIPAPASLLRGLTSLIGQQSKFDKLTANCIVDSAKLRTALKWNPPLSTCEGILRAMRK